MAGDGGAGELERCPWAIGSEWERAYHDEEWGVPIAEDCRLLELLVLEGSQAGLSWATVLAKRTHYRLAFHDFDPRLVAAFSHEDVDRLVVDLGLIRHRGKLEAAVAAARATLLVQEEFGSLRNLLAEHIGPSALNHWMSVEDVPTQTAASDALSRELRRRGFRFLGPTTCYAFMQAAGFVNDHLVACHRHATVEALIRAR